MNEGNGGDDDDDLDIIIEEDEDPCPVRPKQPEDHGRENLLQEKLNSEGEKAGKAAEDAGDEGGRNNDSPDEEEENLIFNLDDDDEEEVPVAVDMEADEDDEQGDIIVDLEDEDEEEDDEEDENDGDDEGKETEGESRKESSGIPELHGEETVGSTQDPMNNGESTQHEGGEKEVSADKLSSRPLAERKKKRRKLGISMPTKKSKKKAVDEQKFVVADLAHKRLDDLSAAEIASLMSLQASSGLGLDRRGGRLLKLDHPRVTEYPYMGDLKAYVLGQLNEMRRPDGRNIYHSERFAGFAALMSNIASFLDRDSDAGKVSRSLFADAEVCKRLAFVVMHYLVCEMPTQRSGRDARGRELGGARRREGQDADESARLEKIVMVKIGDLLSILYHVLARERNLEVGRRRFWNILKPYQVIQALVARSLDLLDTQLTISASPRGPVSSSQSLPSKYDAMCSTARYAGSMFPKLLRLWSVLFQSDFLEAHHLATCLQLFVRHRNLESCLRHLQQCAAKKDSLTERALTLLSSLLTQRKLLLLLARSSAFSAARDGILKSSLAELARVRLNTDGVQRKHFEILARLLEEEDAKGAVLYVESTRTLLLEGVSALIAFYEKLCPSPDEEYNKDQPQAAHSGAVADCFMFLRIYGRLAQGDARPFAAALYQKFGGTPIREERIILHVRRVSSWCLPQGLSEQDMDHAKNCLKIIDALENKKELLEILGDAQFDKSEKEMQAGLQTLQREKTMAEETLSFDDNEKGMAVIQSGQCVLVQGEQAQQFRFKDKHIEWLRRKKNASEPVPFVMLARNVYLHRKYKQLKPDDIQVCKCRKWPGRAGCSDDTCLLRQLYVECTPGFCPCQETARIPQGEFVIEYMGEILNQKTYQRRKKLYEVEHNTYFMALRTEPIFEMIDASRKSTMARFINHSCDPNCETRKFLSLGEIVVGIFARQDIEEGEELTFDYQMVDGALGRKCRCGAVRCRGSLTPKAMREDQKRRRKEQKQLQKKQT